MFSGHLRSFRGQLVAPNSNLIYAINLAYKKTRFGENCFQVTVGHLRSFRRHFEVFCCSKLKSDKHNRISVPKNLKKTFTCPKGDLVRELCYQSQQVTWGHLGVVWKSIGSSKIKRHKRNRFSIPKRHITFPN